MAEIHVEAAAGTLAARPPEGIAESPLRLLHVAQDPRERAGLRAALVAGPLNLDFDFAPTLREATARLDADTPPDVVLLDWPLTDPEAIGLVSLVRQQAPRTWVLVAAAPSDDAALVAALDAGADDYLVKGRTTPQDLHGALARAAAQRATARPATGRVIRVIYVGAVDVARRQFLKLAPEIQLAGPPVGGDLLPAVPEPGAADVSLPQDALVVEDGSPGVNALELLREVRRRGLQLPVVVVTGAGRENVGAHALRLGAAAHLVKTEKYFVALRHTLTQVVAHSRLARNYAKVARSEAQLQAILESQPVGVMAVGKDGTLLAANAALVSMSGAGGRAEILGRSLYGLVAADDREAVRTWVKSVAEGQRAALTFGLAAADGGRQTVDADGVPFKPVAEQGAVVLAVLRRTTTAAVAPGIPLDAATGHPTPMFVLAGDRFRFANRAMAELTGYTEEQLRGVAPAEIVHPDDREALAEVLKPASSSSGQPAPLSRAVRILSRRQSERWVMLQVATSPASADGELFGTAVDITEAVETKRALSNAEARAERAAADAAAARAEADRLGGEARALAGRIQAETGGRAALPPAPQAASSDGTVARRLQRLESVAGLAAAVSEEWAGLLDVVDEAARRLRQQLPAVDSKDPASLIVDAAAQGRPLARQLLTFSRKYSQRASPLDVAQALGAADPVVRGIAGESIDVNVSCDPQLPGVAADGEEFLRAVAGLTLLGRNLLRCGGSLGLRAAATTGPAVHGSSPLAAGVQISVSATGWGMDGDLQDSLLQPGRRAGDVTSPVLKPVRAFVAEHGGEMTIATEPGRRTTFTLHLPAADRN